jgi:hypothetical protein
MSREATLSTIAPLARMAAVEHENLSKPTSHQHNQSSYIRFGNYFQVV